MTDRTGDLEPAAGVSPTRPLPGDMANGVLAASPDCILVLSAVGRIVFVNDRCLELKEIPSAEAVLGLEFAAIWPEAERAKVRDATRRAAAGEVNRIEGFGPTALGKPRWWEVSFAPVALDGRPMHVVAVSRDVSERHAVQEALRQTEERLQLTLSNAQIVGFWNWHVPEDMVVADRRFARLFGVDPDRAQAGVPVADFIGGIHPEDRDRVAGVIQRGLITAEPFAEEYRLLVGNGPARYVLAYGQCVHDEHGMPSRFPGIVVDITDQRVAENALRGSEAALRTSEGDLRLALEAGRFGSWSRDLRTDEITTSALCRTIFGRDSGDRFTYAELCGAIHPDDRARMASSVAESIATGSRYDIEYRILTPSGDMRWLSMRGQPAYAADGSAARMTGIAFDITEVKQDDARRMALVDLADRFRDLDDATDVSFAAAEILGRTLGVSRAGYGTVDLAAETITIERDWNMPGSASLAGVLHFRDYGSYVEDLQRGETVVFGNAETDPRTAAMADALKAIGAQSVINMPVTEQGGLVALLYLNHVTAREWSEEDLAFIRDVAERTRSAVERRRAQNALRDLAGSLERQVIERTAALQASEARLRTMFETSYEYQGLLSLDGTLLDANATSLAGIGASLEDVRGKPFWELPWFAATPAVSDLVRAAIPMVASGAVIRQEINVNLPVAGWRWFDFTMRPLRDVTGQVIAVVPEALDITQRRQAEEALRQSQKMEAVGQLTGGLAHDFNNLLTGIAGSLEVLETRLAQGRLRELDRYITAAQGAAKRAAALTHRLLAFSRRQTLEPKLTQIDRLIAEMEELIRRTVGPAITVEVVGTARPWHTLIDQNQLENALLNLCINARDAMPDGGRLTVETSNKWLDERGARERDLEPGQYVALCVSDTGAGMSPEVIERAFDPFFTTKPIGAGTGLGLSMVYGFVRQSGGQARIYSEPGQGSMVCLYLPRHLGDEAERDTGSWATTDTPRAHDGETVLIVDDEPTVRMLVTEVLEELGYTTVEAGDGAAGLKLLQSDARIDLLVTDVGLPGGMNGRQLADAARVARPELNVLFITGYAENAVVGNGHLDAGMHVLTKPFAMDVLASRVKTIIAAG